MPVQYTEAPPPHRRLIFELNIQGFAAIAVRMEDIVIFCASTLCSDLMFRSFGGTLCLHLQGERRV